MAKLRKNISIDEEDFKIIYDFASKKRFSVSDFLRIAAKEYIKREESVLSTEEKNILNSLKDIKSELCDIKSHLYADKEDLTI